MYTGYITDVPGIRVGHAQNLEAMTGCTVILTPTGTTGGVDVRGSAPGTRETDLFQERKAVNEVHAVVLSGGSAFGLDAASGAMAYLAEQNIGFETPGAKVPIVASAVLYDLEVGSPHIRPDKEMGYQASGKASSDENSQGNFGAGTGASVGKILGPDNAMKGGLGSASVQVGDLVVGAIVAVNAVGDIFDPLTNTKIAGVYDHENAILLDTIEIMKAGHLAKLEGQNTTIGVVATNAKLDKAMANKVAEMTHNAYAKAINPVHTMFDGDTVFALATNEVDADVNLVGILAVEAMTKAIANAIYNAESYGSLLAHRDVVK
ncbi:P1 family peptidase [Aerococcaceae bacterium DSM 111176]|nr:P1 family peptidase [Aerococcaceae bacterium DSM 111176]